MMRQYEMLLVQCLPVRSITHIYRLHTDDGTAGADTVSFVSYHRVTLQVGLSDCLCRDDFRLCYDQVSRNPKKGTGRVRSRH